MADVINQIRKVKRRLNMLQRDARWKLGMDRPDLKNAKGGRILIYHGVCIDKPFRFNSLFVKLKNFEAQLKFYKKYFNIISLDDFYQGRFSNSQFNVCLTFDDGFANNYNYVLPLLEFYEIPATFFITSIREAGYNILWNDLLAAAYKFGPKQISIGGAVYEKLNGRQYRGISTGQRLADDLRKTGFAEKMEMMTALGACKKNADSDYWLQMNVDEIKKMSASKWATIGSHSYFHNDLASLPGDTLETDLLRSKQFLEKITGKTITSLAFPYGSYSDKVIYAAIQAGYTQLLTTAFNEAFENDHAFLKDRLTINPFISDINQIFASIKGTYD